MPFAFSFYLFFFSWTAREVAERWARLFPPRKAKGRGPANVEAWIAAHADDSRWVETARKRLGNLSWFMKWLIAGAHGQRRGCVHRHLLEGRFKSIAILDEASLLATCAYIDLNPVAAGAATTPEESLHRRLLL